MFLISFLAARKTTTLTNTAATERMTPDTLYTFVGIERGWLRLLGSNQRPND